MRAALDTNLLVYAEGVNGAERQRQAQAILAALPGEGIVLPVQVLGELFAVLVRKAGWTPERARSAVLQWCDAWPLAETTTSVFLSAVDLAADHRLFIWDSVILAAAAEAKCRLLLSEDMQAGFTWRGVTVVDPFTEPRDPLLAALLVDP